ncbi:Sec-independent protein translocase protein TatB [Pseudotabrizicola sp.]|uniref:Sec-independent protein translocase protein TatB n=1 Tax=Pseudotabrizicola sp. TaxID=2939647 RepID=UPI0027164C04|nr:Sec-independent protein translocase protein TatB [Pseudotabrizicola sp.]MDO8881852.1 Sec-independent protein translocase protein TatB [Pseudotabrizicola sp.]
MLDLGMSELLVIGIVALIVIGPKDLPELFRSLGRFTAKMRGMAREFSRAMEAAADESGVKDVAKDLKSVTSAKSMGLEAVKEATAKFEKWDPLKNAARPTTAAKPALQPDPQAAPPAAPPPEPAPAMGPATQALADAKAARQAIVKEAAAKLKKPATPAATPAATDAASASAPIKKPRAPRKPKSDQTPKADV